MPSCPTFEKIILRGYQNGFLQPTFRRLRRPANGLQAKARAHLGGPAVPDVFRVVVDGFAASDISVTGPGSTIPVASPAAGMTIVPRGNVSATLPRIHFVLTERAEIYYKSAFFLGNDGSKKLLNPRSSVSP